MIIAVWGNNGSGKSTIAVKLANKLAKNHHNVLLIDTNFIAPQAQIWFPKTPIKENNTLANLLNSNIDTELVASKISMISENLGVLGYGPELAINAISAREDTPEELLSIANSLADYVIVDCQSNITQDILSFTALDIADTRILSITPDLRGLSWYNSNVKMVSEKWDSLGAKVIKVFNKVRPTAPAEAVDKAINNIQYYFPYCDEIADELYSGEMSQTKFTTKNSKKYGQLIDDLLLRV